MKTGHTKLDIAHGALLLELFGIYHVSGDVFFKHMAEFKRVLEPIGLAGQHRFGALYPLWEKRKNQGLSILRPITNTRGLTSGSNDALTLRIGELVNIEIDYPSNGFITLFEIGPTKTELTVPSLHRTDITLQKGRTILPAEKKFFNVEGPPGDYWLLAAVTNTRPLLPNATLPSQFNPAHPALVLNEKQQAEFVALLQACPQLEVFALPYVITRPNLP